MVVMVGVLTLLSRMSMLWRMSGTQPPRMIVTVKSEHTGSASSRQRPVPCFSTRAEQMTPREPMASPMMCSTAAAQHRQTQREGLSLVSRPAPASSPHSLPHPAC